LLSLLLSSSTLSLWGTRTRYRGGVWVGNQRAHFSAFALAFLYYFVSGWCGLTLLFRGCVRSEVAERKQVCTVHHHHTRSKYIRTAPINDHKSIFAYHYSVRAVRVVYRSIPEPHSQTHARFQIQTRRFVRSSHVSNPPRIRLPRENPLPCTSIHCTWPPYSHSRSTYNHPSSTQQ
jgi:hypothetical protein